jgi:hypothetical protein
MKVRKTNVNIHSLKILSSIFSDMRIHSSEKSGTISVFTSMEKMNKNRLSVPNHFCVEYKLEVFYGSKCDLDFLKGMKLYTI